MENTNKPEVVESDVIVRPSPEPKQEAPEEKEMSFWDHLDELRGTLFRIAIGIMVAMIVVFANKSFVFDTVILAPKSSDFIVYRFMGHLADWLSIPSLRPDPFNIQLININMAGQFFVHLGTSFWLGLVIAFPWVIYQLWLFIRPALYEHERKYSTAAFLAGSGLFFLGVAVGYFMVFPLAIRFLGMYQVSDMGLVPNTISLNSYISMFTTLTMAMGLVFEMPMLLYFLSRIGIVTKKFLRKYRRHAIVIIAILAAIITPTPDPFTMIAVAAPIVGLYEFSIWICKK